MQLSIADLIYISYVFFSCIYVLSKILEKQNTVHSNKVNRSAGTSHWMNNNGYRVIQDVTIATYLIINLKLLCISQNIKFDFTTICQSRRRLNACLYPVSHKWPYWALQKILRYRQISAYDGVYTCNEIMPIRHNTAYTHTAVVVLNSLIWLYIYGYILNFII